MAEALIVTKSPRDDHQIDLTIELGPERTEQALQRAARVVSKKARIPGFRPGKAPYATILRMFGKDAILSEILDELGQEVYKEVLEGEDIDPYGQASLDDVKTDPLTFKLVVAMQPTVELGDYSGIRVEAPDVSVNEADVDAALEAERTAHQVLQPVSRAAELGDTVKVDIKGTVGENTIMDNQDWELTLRGESGWLPGFDEAFLGLSAGDEKGFELVYPEDSASRYKGQAVTFHVAVKEVKTKVLPEADDAFVASLGDYADLADYRAKKMAEIQTQREAEAKSKLNDSAVEALVERGTIVYPPRAVDNTVTEMARDMEMRLANIGYTLEDSLRLQGKSIDAYRRELRPVAEKRLNGRLALAELARREGISVTPEEEQAELDRLALQAGDEAEAGKIREVFGSEAGLALLRQDLLTEKSLARLREIVTGAVTGAVPEESTPLALPAEETGGGEAASEEAVTA